MAGGRTLLLKLALERSLDEVVHCSRELAFSTPLDRALGQSVDVYRCKYCGTEMKEYRPKKQIGRD